MVGWIPRVKGKTPGNPMSSGNLCSGVMRPKE
jgi:hypothetical protein